MTEHFPPLSPSLSLAAGVTLTHLMPDDQVILTREVEVTLIPQGTPMSLPEGETVTITHRLGGNFTVMTHNGMFRIKGIDADCLGEEVTPTTKDAAADSHDVTPP